MNLQRPQKTSQKARERPPAGSVPVDATQYFIEDIYPTINGGRYAVKRIAGEVVDVWADIFRDGTEITVANLVWRREGEEEARVTSMQHRENDRWHGQFVPPEPGRYSFQIEVWSDPFATWQRDLKRRLDAGQDVAVELEEGRLMLAEAGAEPPEQGGEPEAWLSPELGAQMLRAQPRGNLVSSTAFPLIVDRERARAGAWYEIMARSQGKEPGRSATFDDCIARLPDIAAMGFDVLYLLPIHPIGRKARKGKNNSLKTEPGDPGSPYAIGSEEGGHDAIHSELGTLDDFHRLVAACHEHGMEVALDFAIQCSPDHPWVRDHPEWFRHRPDGTIRYAENPPKKYEDIVNVDFHSKDAPALWTALRDVVLFWVHQGVRIFRVDNPHTKPFPFWEWMIAEVQRVDPGVIFLSEAFTRPKVMKGLAKLGFTQSYTYFTWRTQKWEIQEYLSELTGFPTREFFRPNFFMTTPDILPYHLQGGEPWAFKARFALASLLSSTYGLYNGYELLEHEPIPGKEEYLNSEKYEFKVRDWNKPGNIKSYISRVNRLRRENPALLQTNNLRFLQVDNDRVIGFVKDSVDGTNAVAAAISVEGSEPKDFWFHFGETEVGPPGNRRPVTGLENLVSGHRYRLEWGGVRLSINPHDDPALLFRCLS